MKRKNSLCLFGEPPCVLSKGHGGPHRDAHVNSRCFDEPPRPLKKTYTFRLRGIETEVKGTAAGVKHDAEKTRMDLWPPIALERVAEVLTYGARKYIPEGWRSVPDAKARYTAALLRHLTAVMKGEARDPESGLLHLAHVATNAAFLLELES
jgi:hypothetical protein